MLFVGCLSAGSHEDHKFSACSLSLMHGRGGVLHVLFVLSCFVVGM